MINQLNITVSKYKTKISSTTTKSIEISISNILNVKVCQMINMSNKYVVREANVFMTIPSSYYITPAVNTAL
jgi:hypothetical protein